MSEQVGGILQMAQSYHFNRNQNNNYKSRSIDPSSFHQWHKDNMYKSSYAQFHSRNSVQPKNTVIPGYAGYIPKIKADNIHAKGFSNMAKQSFSSDKLAKNVFGLATTGFNVTKEVFIDNSKFGSTSKYGKSALQKPHPNWNVGNWVSTTQQFYKNPNSLVNPVYRKTDKFLQSRSAVTKSSGFGINHSYFDGKGWKPDPILKGDVNRSEYRDRFNKQKQFHRSTFMDKIRKLPHKQLNYKLN